MSQATYLVGDVFDRMAELADGSVDLIVTSPPFLALRSYLPADHPDKAKEIGSEPTPAAFIDTMLALSAEWRRLLAPHGSIAVELGDTYAGPQPPFRYTEAHSPDKPMATGEFINNKMGEHNITGRVGDGWPLAKSKTLIPELYRTALAYGIHPLTGQASPAGTWRVRNVVTWCRPNPPVGALGDKWRPGTSDIVVACVSGRRYWDDIATRRPFAEATLDRTKPGSASVNLNSSDGTKDNTTPMGIRAAAAMTQSGAPLLDYWEIPPGGYPGSHYAVYPPALVEPLVKAMAPPRVCVECGEPARRIVETVQQDTGRTTNGAKNVGRKHESPTDFETRTVSQHSTVAWTDCGHDNYRPAMVLDPFAGSGTTLLVATGHGHNAIGIDIDERNAQLARERIGGLFLTVDEGKVAFQT